jgi:hypothetical protein
MQRTATATYAQRRGCDGKARHGSRKDAAAVARLVGGMHAYRCPLCNAWHVGHGRIG